MQVVWWILLFASAFLFMALAGVIFPKLFLKTGGFLDSKDRGLTNFKEKNGSSVLYEPAPAYKKYINQYILSDRQGKKILVCKADDNITSLDFDVVIFDCFNKAVDVINITEKINPGCLTLPKELPAQTAYVSIIVNQANGIAVGTSASREKSSLNRKLAFFSGVTALIMFAEIFFVKFCIAQIFGDVFVEFFMMDTGSIILTAAIVVVSAAVALTAAIIYIKLKTKMRTRWDNHEQL